MTDHILKRSVVIAGRKTAVSLEAAFWREVTRLAGLDGVTITAFLTGIDGARAGRSRSSSIRIAVLERLRRERDQLVEALKPRLAQAGTGARRPGADDIATGDLLVREPHA